MILPVPMAEEAASTMVPAAPMAKEGAKSSDRAASGLWNAEGRS